MLDLQPQSESEALLIAALVARARELLVTLPATDAQSRGWLERIEGLVHTPLAEVLELAAIAADRAFAESLEILARDDVTLKPELREWLEAFTQTQTRAAFLTGYARLKREAADEARG